MNSNPYQAPHVQLSPKTVRLRFSYVGYLVGFAAGVVLAVSLIGRYTGPSDWGVGYQVAVRSGGVIFIAGLLGALLVWCIERWLMHLMGRTSQSVVGTDGSSKDT